MEPFLREATERIGVDDPLLDWPGRSGPGPSGYGPPALFKCLLVGQCHGLSAPKRGHALKVQLDFMLFCGLDLQGSVPDETLIKSAARQALQRDLAPRFAAFNSENMMNTALFQRIEHLNANRDGNTAEQNRVLDLYHRMFVRAGANLKGDTKKRLPEVTARLAELGTAFTQNLLKDEADWYMELGPNDLDGLPDFLLSAAAEAAKERDIDGHIVTLSRPITVNVCNFAKAPAGQPSLLTFDDAHTLFHEFGHALHSMLSDGTTP